MCERSYYPNYFSIDDILVTQEKVPCKTLRVIHRLGWLKPGSKSEHINADTSLELPLWIALMSTEKGELIKVDVPEMFQEHSWAVFQADSTVINLFRLNQFYYEYGIYLASMDVRDRMPIEEMMEQIFRERLKMLMEWVDNIMSEAIKIHELDTSEQSLLKSGQAARLKLDSWLVQGSWKMEAADIVTNLKKRKLPETEED